MAVSPTAPTDDRVRTDWLTIRDSAEVGALPEAPAA